MGNSKIFNFTFLLFFAICQNNETLKTQKTNYN